MRKLTFLSAALFLILASSCKKDPSTDPLDHGDKLKSYSETLISSYENTSVTFNVTYDNQDRITMLASASGASGNNDKIAFSFSNNNYAMDMYSGGTLLIHEDFYLKNDLIDSTFQYNDTQDTTTEKYFYNAAKQLTKMLEYEWDNGPELDVTTLYNYDANGNVIKSTDSYHVITTYEYYEDKVNNVPVLFPNQLTKSVSLMKKQTVNYGGGDIETIDYTYTFDSKSRIATVTQVASDGSTLVQTFTYMQ